MPEADKKDILRNIRAISEGPGIVQLKNNNSILYVAKASNLQRTLESYFTVKPNNETWFQLISLTRTIVWEETSDLFTALVREKTIKSPQAPEYNNLIKDYIDFSYLGIDFFHVPYFNICENTLGDQLYIGPFFNRFFLLDFLDTMSLQNQYPFCADEKFPCSRYDSGLCDGYCLQPPENLWRIIRQTYLAEDKEMIKNLEKKISEFEADLNFKEAAELEQRLNLILKYYEYLGFLYVVKKLDLSFREGNIAFTIKHGQLANYELTGERWEFNRSSPSYRKNEYLAINKDHLAESWIIFQHLKKNNSQKMTEIYKHSRAEFIRILGKEDLL